MGQVGVIVVVLGGCGFGWGHVEQTGSRTFGGFRKGGFGIRSHWGEQEGPMAGFLHLDTQQVCHLLAQDAWGGEGPGVELPARSLAGPLPRRRTSLPSRAQGHRLAAADE